MKKFFDASGIHDAYLSQYSVGGDCYLDAAADAGSRRRTSGHEFLGVLVSTNATFQGAQDSGTRRRGGFSVRLAVFFIAGYCVGIVGAAAVAAGSEWGMYGVTVSYTSLLIASIWNSWMIMRGIGQDERKRSQLK